MYFQPLFLEVGEKYLILYIYQYIQKNDFMQNFQSDVYNPNT